MAPKPVFKVHSLSKHIEETTKGLNADARGKKPATARPSIKKTAAATPAAGIFANNDSDSDSSSSSDDSDSDDNGPTFLKDLTKSTGTKRRSKDDEIADSDVERTAAASKAKPVKKAAAAPAKAKAASSSNDSSSESESESSDEEVSSNGAALKSKASSTSATSPTSSSGSDSGSSSAASSSDEGSESESESEAAPAKPVPVVKQPASKPAPAKPVESESEDSSSEESESESEEESEPAAKPQKKPAANGSKAAPKATKPASDSSSEDESEEESSDGESSEEEADESMQVAERAQAGQIALPQFMPPDFELRKGDQQSNGQDVARVCSEANLQGKQLWYFTLPANVPVSVVENLEFPMDRSQQSGSILSHDGQDYGISFDSMAPTKSIQILIPSADGSTYKPTNRAVDEVMQIRRITQVGATTAAPAAVGSSTKAPRPQPKGLKARFQPIGVNSDMGTLGPDEDSDDDVEMQDAPTGSTPKASQKKDKKRKEAAGPKESAGKSKQGKRKHSISEDEDAAAAEQLMEESVSAVTKSKKQKTASRGSPDLGSEPTPKKTLVVPPSIPGVDTPAKKSKKAVAKPATPLPSSQVSNSKKETPVPVPVVPSLSKTAPAGTPVEKKAKKRKEKVVPSTPE